jgi:hypothetical protein
MGAANTRRRHEEMDGDGERRDSATSATTA